MAPRLAGRIYARRMTRRDGWMFGPWSIFCAPWGNDTTGNGTWHNPYRTVGKAATIIHDTTGGWTVFCRGGTYAFALDAEPNVHVGTSGSASSPFVFRNFPGERPKITIAAGTTSWGFKLFGSNFVTIRGFEICPADRGALGVEISESSDCVVEHCEYWSTIPTSGQIGVHIRANSAADGGAPTDRNIVRHNHFHDFGAAVGEGVYLKKYRDNADSVDGNVVEYNLFSGAIGSEAFQNTSGISKQVPTNTVFRGNVMRCTCTDNGMAHLEPSGLVMENNIFIGSGGNYGCLSITLNAYTTIANIIRNNLIKWSTNYGSSVKGICIGAGHASASLNMHHNTLIEIGNAGAGDAYGIGLWNKAGTYEIKNNIIYDPKNKVIDAGTASVTTDYNNLHGTAGDNGSNANTDDPAFADTNEYRLGAGSPGLASGLGGLVVYDLNRRPRDAAHPTMGCHEYP